METKLFVIYKITNLINNHFYVGAHATDDLNDKYFGSGTGLKAAIKQFGKINFKKEILFVYNNKEDMFTKEAEIVTEEFCARLDTYNKIKGGNDWAYTKGMVSVKDKNGNRFLVYTNDHRYISGELVATSKGTICIYDEFGNSKRIPVDQYNPDIHVHFAKNKIVVKDENDNVFFVLKSDPRYLSGELKPVEKGRKKPNCWAGRKHTQATKEKLSARAKERTGEKNSQFGTCWVTNGIVNKKIKKEDLENWIALGYYKGMI